MTPTEVLEAAKQKIAQGWCQGSYERDGCVCASGAFFSLADEPMWWDAREFLEQAIGTPCVIEWNDRDGRTQAEVLAAFDKAIELSKAREQ